LELEGLTWTRLGVEHFTALFDLTLHLYEAPEGLHGLFEYATDLFDRETIERMTGHFRVLLEGVVADPDERVQLLPLLKDNERKQLMRVFNATALSTNESQLVHERFEAQAETMPNAVAVVCGTVQLTYEELSSRANQLAHFLLGRGVRPDERVALYTERGIDMIVGLLGILKAGAAYVPLDTSYPAERLSHMLRDSAPAVVLTQSRLRGSVPLTKALIVSLDEDAEEIARQSIANPGSAQLGLEPRHLAYVIYTSGSTGTPKGVMVEHRNLANLVDWHCAQFKLTAGCRCSCVAAVGFDAAGWEIWPALSIGATLVVAPPLL
jgi:non-ribosomal peptide synthetase component F